MKRIALQLLLSLALIFQGVSAFGLPPAQHARCCDGEHAAHAHCQHGHGTPCTSNCVQHCIGCTAAAFAAMPQLAISIPAESVAVPSFTRTSANSRDDLPPTRPPIV